MACRGRGEGQGLVRGRRQLGSSADDGNVIIELANTSVQRSQDRYAGLSVERHMNPCSNILNRHSRNSSRNQFYIASTPAHCICICFCF